MFKEKREIKQKNCQQDSYNDFMLSKKQKQFNPRNSFNSKTKNKLNFFAVIATNPLDIVFEKTIDKIKKINPIYVTTQINIVAISPSWVCWKLNMLLLTQ